MDSKKVVILCGSSASSNIVYNELKNKFNIALVICESSPPKWLLIRRRYRRLGLVQVIGQLLFQVFVQKLLKKFSAERVQEICTNYKLKIQQLDSNVVKFVDSVNSKEVINLLQQIAPSVIIVNGTRIISQEVLSCVKATFINTHMGITPKYRGVHGAYWALINHDLANCGVTVQLVDKGIDTGGIIAQKVIGITKNDNFITYPFLQLAAALPSLIEAIENSFAKKISIVPRDDLNSCLWHHPTLWTYLFNRIIKQVK